MGEKLKSRKTELKRSVICIHERYSLEQSFSMDFYNIHTH